MEISVLIMPMLFLIALFCSFHHQSSSLLLLSSSSLVELEQQQQQVPNKNKTTMIATGTCVTIQFSPFSKVEHAPKASVVLCDGGKKSCFFLIYPFGSSRYMLATKKKSKRECGYFLANRMYNGGSL